MIPFMIRVNYKYVYCMHLQYLLHFQSNSPLHSLWLYNLIDVFCDCYSRLGNFVKMVDQVILAQFVHIIKTSVAEFTHKVIQNAPETNREAMFKCSLQFNKGMSLEHEPF